MQLLDDDISTTDTGKHVPNITTQLALMDGRNQCPSLFTEDRASVVPPHPLGVKPAGNAYVSYENIKSVAGFFSMLSDELIVQVLEVLDHRLLLRLGATCKALYAFCRFDDLWRTLFVEYVFFLS